MIKKCSFLMFFALCFSANASILESEAQSTCNPNAIAEDALSYSSMGLTLYGGEEKSVLQPNPILSCKEAHYFPAELVQKDPEPTLVFNQSETARLLVSPEYAFDRWGYRFFTLKIRKNKPEEPILYLQLATNCLEGAFVGVAAGSSDPVQSIDVSISPVLDLIPSENRTVGVPDHQAFQLALANVCKIPKN